MAHDCVDRHLVAVWDEFQELADLKLGDDADCMSHLRSIWQRHERMAYIVSGSAPSMLRNLVSSKHSPFFQHFDVMELPPMQPTDAVELLTNGSEGAIAPALAKRVVSVIGGHPLYLQMVGQAAIGTEQEALERILERGLVEGRGHL